MSNTHSGNGEYEQSLERQDWVESLDATLENLGAPSTASLLETVYEHAKRRGVKLPSKLQTDYVNTIPAEEQPAYPGDRDLEHRLRSLIRWNAMAMVVRANREESGIGGHISTFASSATLLDVGWNHFFRGRNHPCGGDHIYFQGHASPGNYARAYLEGRLSEEHLRNFRREIRSKKSLSSYPHPWLMPDFWEFPTVSMGLGPLQAIYRARFLRYLEHRGLKPATGEKVWAFLGDGETDEPESLGSLTLASREKLDNLIFVVNCNLQRLDGPVRGNGKIIQELEAAFRGAGWNVIKVLWGSEWDELIARDQEGRLVKRFNEAVDGEYQRFRAENGAYIREHFFGKDPALLEMVSDYSDEKIWGMHRGGHDPLKVYAAYKAAFEHTGQPTVILAKTIKGYGFGEAGEGRNITHQQKKLNEEELKAFRDRFSIPVSDEQLNELPFFRPPKNSPEMRYLQSRLEELGGPVPERKPLTSKLKTPSEDLYREFHEGSSKEIATTMATVRVMSKLLKDPQLGKLIVPIVPDEARTFGMESLFRQHGIYSSVGQLYEPVDVATLMYYKEAKDGQILEEGITEAGAMCSFLAAGTSYAYHRTPTIPFFFYYSMFGFQRIADLIWAACDSRARGFLLGATAGRTTLSGEGLQHQDGHSHLFAEAFPTVKAYDPAFAYEIAVIVEDGLKRICEKNEDWIYYLTIGNENYVQPPMPSGVREGILRGIYRFRSSQLKKAKSNVQLFGSGSILNEVLKAQEILSEKFSVGADVWSVTSYKELHQDALDAERWNLFNPEEKPKPSFLAEQLANTSGPFIAASDYVKALPDCLAKWIPGKLTSLGTDGFGRSDGRRELRDFFEVDAKHIAWAALVALAREGKLESKILKSAKKEMQIRSDKANPMRS